MFSVVHYTLVWVTFLCKHFLAKVNMANTYCKNIPVITEAESQRVWERVLNKKYGDMKLATC